MDRMYNQNPAENPLLVFDWGNTLMKVFPGYEGPMANWPEVAEVDGTVEALEALKDQYQMVVATNAGDSDATAVWKALRRVGFGEYFKAVFTSHELGCQKPDNCFFYQLESVLTRPTHQIIMVGDSFLTDILGAKQAGWRSIWYNPNHESAPGLLPLHDAEIYDLRQLPAAIKQTHYPDYPTCLAWLLEHGTPFNILAHVQLVAAAAYQLAIWLAQKDAPVNPVLTHRGGLLHDLAKIDSIRMSNERGDSGDHARMAHDALLQHNQPELAEIANRHMPFTHIEDDRRPITWEQKLVHFADKLVEGAELVPVEARIHALKNRYPEFAEGLGASLPRLLEMQDEICELLEITPDRMIERLRKAVMGR